jgi:hypothetical protein
VPTATRKTDLYWAVVDHVRSWLSEDGAFRWVIDEKDGELDGVTLRRISMIYNVSRGVRADKSGTDKHAHALARLLNGARPWPTSLVERANKCLEVARKAKALGHTSGLQVSAVTKFSWFAQPAFWTVYDRFVSRAVGARSERTEERMIEFYQILEGRGFLEIALQIQRALDEVRIMDLQGTRVLDKLMMLKGAEGSEPEWADNVRRVCQGFLDILPADWRQAIEEIGERVGSCVEAGRLFRTG